MNLNGQITNFLGRLGIVKPGRLADDQQKSQLSSTQSVNGDVSSEKKISKKLKKSSTRPRSPGVQKPLKKSSPSSGMQKASGKKSTRGRIPFANSEQIKGILAFKGQVLTASGESFAINEKGQKIVAVLDDGSILMTEGNSVSAFIIELRRRMVEKGLVIRRELCVEADILSKVYANFERQTLVAEDTDQTDSTQMRRDFFNLVEEAASIKSSDIHILNQRYEALVRVRADGVMQDFRSLSSAYASEFMSAIFYMSDVSDSSYRPMDYQGARIGSSSAALPEGIQSIRLQFNPLPNGGRQMVARLLYSQSAGGDSNDDIDSLGYSAIHVRDMHIMRRKPFGIVIISGPTGSGKSTTLQKALMRLMQEKRYQINVLTIEDPPEYIIEGAAQIPVTNADSEEERSAKFQAAISAALRSDPDVIMIGEIRDKASSSLAFAASMTGHQVWTSLHANDAVSILDRFKDHEVEDYKLTDPTLVTGLVGQRLMRKLCNSCKVPMNDAILFEDDRVLDPLMMDAMHAIIEEENFDRIYVASESGCDDCRNGYTGRTVVAETIVPDRKFMQYIAKGDKVGAIEYWKSDLGGLSVLEHATLKMFKGEVDPRELEAKVEPLSLLDKDRIPFIIEQSDKEIEKDIKAEEELQALKEKMKAGKDD